MKVLQFATLATAALVGSVIGKSTRDTCNGTLKTKLVDLATESDVLQTLVAAVTEADLLGLLEGSTDYTIFAPNDDAFKALDMALMKSDMSLADVLANKDLLTSVLALHVVPMEYSSDELSNGMMLDSLGGEITIGMMDDMATVTGPTNTANIIGVDLVACNGVVHLIDAVLLPEMEGMDGESEMSEMDGDMGEMSEMDGDMGEMAEMDGEMGEMENMDGDMGEMEDMNGDMGEMGDMGDMGDMDGGMGEMEDPGDMGDSDMDGEMENDE